MIQSHREQVRQYGEIVAAAWADPAFKQRLLADPAGVLREGGLDVPTGRQVRVVEDSHRLVHLVLPARPEEARLSNEQLDQVAGGRGEDLPKLPPSA